MLILIQLIQKLVKALNSEGTPGQVALGIALGSALGLTPLVNLHNLIIFAAIMVFNVSFPGAMVGWVLFIPVGFALDPVFDALGRLLLLQTSALVPLWTAMYNMPVVPLTNFNNSVVLGSFLVWLVALVPLYFLARWGVREYRARIYERLIRTRAFQVIQASKAYNVYRLFRP